MRARETHGFTLIEVMIAMAIIGILASVAIPVFRQAQLRSKAAERGYIVTAVYRAIEEIYVRENRFPQDLGDGASYLNLDNAQPDAVPTPARKPWRHLPVDGSDHWPALQLFVEGGLYYRYGGHASAAPGAKSIFLYAFGDLDGDGVRNRWEKTWTWVGGVKQRIAGSTLDCGDCTVAYEHNGWSW